MPWVLLAVVLGNGPFHILFTDALNTVDLGSATIAPELSSSHVNLVTQWVSTAMGDNDNQKSERYAGARSLATQVNDELGSDIPDHELVYGELSIPVLARIFDAVGIREGEKFLDIGSGDGALVFGASLLYPDHMCTSRGMELVRGLVDRSKTYLEQLKNVIQEENSGSFEKFSSSLETIDLSVGNVYDYKTDKRIASILSDTTLAVCFATTWSAANNIEMQGEELRRSTSLKGRKLPQLSAALRGLPPKSRVVIVDGTLDCKDGFVWGGDLRIECPDTAPYSVASLYERE